MIAGAIFAYTYFKKRKTSPAAPVSVIPTLVSPGKHQIFSEKTNQSSPGTTGYVSNTPVEKEDEELEEVKVEMSELKQPVESTQEVEPKETKPNLSDADTVVTTAVPKSEVTAVAFDESEMLVAFEDLPEGSKKVQVIHPYSASMNDELELVAESIIYLVKTFDDGWALGVDPKTGKQGAFPTVCVKELKIEETSANPAEAGESTTEAVPETKGDDESSQFFNSETIRKRNSSLILQNFELNENSGRNKVPFNLYISQLEKLDGDVSDK